ncbi:MAG: glycosyltransferase involved in cell wall biosynthesis [Myxococcota bacterium]
MVCSRDLRWGGGVAEVARLMVAHLPQAVAHRVGRVPGRSPLWVLADGVRLRRRIQDVGAARVLLNTSLRTRALARDLALARVAMAEGARVCIWVHGADPRWLARLRSGPARAALRSALSGVERLLVLTAEQAEVVSGLGPSVVQVTAAWDPALLDGGPADPATGRRWLFLGRLHPAKGVWTLVRAAAEIPGLQLDLAGTGPEAEPLRSWVCAWGLSDRVRLVGFLDPAAKAAALRSAAGLVLPSRSEGCPVCVLEAMALGLPVVATAVGAIPELAPGPLVASGDVTMLAEALARLDSAPAVRARIGASNAQRAGAFAAPAVAALVDRMGWSDG